MAYQKIKDYAVSATRNVYTAGAWALMIAGGLEIIDGNVLGIASVGYGFMINVPTFFGFGTYLTLRRTRKHIEQFGRLDERFIETSSKWYCDQVGILLAAKEKGLEYQLSKETRYL